MIFTNIFIMMLLTTASFFVSAASDIAWNPPTAINLSESNLDAFDPQIAMSGDKGIAVWYRDDGSSWSVQTKYTAFPPPPIPPIVGPLHPAYASGKELVNKFAMQSDYYNLLTWTASPSSGLRGYAIYSDSNPQPIATVSANTFKYRDSPVSRRSTHVYTIKSVDNSGQESTGYTFTVK